MEAQGSNAGERMTCEEMLQMSSGNE